MPDNAESQASPSSRRRWAWPAVAVLAAVAVGAYIVFIGAADGQVTEDTDEEIVLNTAPVERTDLVEFEKFDGTLRAMEETNIAVSIPGVVTAIAPEGTALDEGDLVYAIDGTAVPLMIAPTDFYRDLSVGAETLSIQAARSGTVTGASQAGTIVEQGDVLYSFDGEPVTVLYGDSLVYRDMYWPEPIESTTRSTLASDVQSDQSRLRLVEAIADAEDRLVETQENTPSNALLNAIDDLTRLESSAATDSEISRANQAVTSAQNADLDRLDAANEAVEAAKQAVADFDEVEAAAERDELENEVVPDTQPNLVGIDVLQLETALVAMGYDPDGSLVVDREFTSGTAAVVERWQADLGVEVDGIVRSNDIVFLPGPAQITDIFDSAGAVAPGTQIAHVSFGPELSGPDVLQLEEALERMGYGSEESMVVDETYTSETRAAVIEWQTATGQEPDGVVHIGDVVVVDDRIRVSTELAPVGTQITPGMAVLRAADLEQIVSFDLDAADQGFADEGDTANVILPDDNQLAGVIEEIASTATITPDGTTVFEVTVRLDNPDAVGDLTEAPVDVELMGSSVSNVLAVPVSALVALSDGGYAIEADSGSGFRLVEVDPGFFADGLVEIDVEGVDAGDSVRLP